MPIDLNQIPSPMFDEPQRSALQLVRRMLLMRWSVGSYLTTNAGNYGIRRPTLGFSNDDFFKAAAQCLMADYKTIGRAFWQVIEIALGPYEDLYFLLTRDEAAGQPYINIEPFGHYILYENWNATPFTQGERVKATHPVTGQVFMATFQYLDQLGGRVFVHRILSPPRAQTFLTGPSPSNLTGTSENFIPDNLADLSFIKGLTLSGLTSGGQVTLTSDVYFMPVDRMPPFARGEIYLPNAINPLDETLGSNNEQQIFVTPESYTGNARVADVLSVQHTQGEIVKVPGGCWDFIEVDARKIVLRIRCEDLQRGGLPGNSYIHPAGLQTARLRAVAGPGDTVLYLDNYETEDVALLPFPRYLMLNPKGRRGVPFLVQATGFNPATRAFTLGAGLPAGKRWFKGTQVQWWQAETGAMTQPALIGAETIRARLRVEDPQGVWVIDPGGPNEELIFIKSSTYRLRHLRKQLKVGAVFIEIDRPITPQEETNHINVLDDTGNLGNIGFGALYPDGYTIALLVASPFASDLENHQTHVELVESASLDSDIELASPLAIAHAPGETLQRVLGTATAQPDYGSIPDAGWPGYPADGKWPGPYLYDPSQRSISNDQGTGLVQVELDRTDPNDLRSYLAGSILAERFDAATATFVKNVGIHRVVEMRVTDTTLFPTEAQVNAWIVDVVNNPTGEAQRITVANEGGYGRAPVYYWGKKDEATIYVSGVQRVHRPGTAVGTYHLFIPILSTSPGVFGGNPGLDLGEGTLLLDFGTGVVETVFYDSIQIRTPTRALLEVERGYVPYNLAATLVPTTDPYKNRGVSGHDRDRASHLITSEILGVQLVRADELSIPQKNGYSFPLYLTGNVALLRLMYMLDLVRAAGIQVELVDEKDVLIEL